MRAYRRWPLVVATGPSKVIGSSSWSCNGSMQVHQQHLLVNILMGSNSTNAFISKLPHQIMRVGPLVMITPLSPDGLTSDNHSHSYLMGRHWVLRYNRSFSEFLLMITTTKSCDIMCPSRLDHPLKRAESLRADDAL